MAKKRSPETFAKRRRALEKQQKRAAKQSERLVRRSEKEDVEPGSDVIDPPTYEDEFDEVGEEGDEEEEGDQQNG